MHNRFIKTSAFFLLLINGIGAIYGGWSMIIDPSGNKLEMPVSYLEYSPFTDYLIPGIILFIANGLFSLFTVVALVFKFRNYEKLIMAQGFILAGWIVIQVILLQIIYFLHFVMGGIGLLLIVCGWLLLHWKNKR